jgi:pilus assembly protein Flp/PilA
MGFFYRDHRRNSIPPMGREERPDEDGIRRKGVHSMLKLYTGLQTWWAELRERVSEERGATAVEYALMVALIAVVIIVAVTFLGESASDKFQQVGDAVAST